MAQMQRSGTGYGGPKKAKKSGYVSVYEKFGTPKKSAPKTAVKKSGPKPKTGQPIDVAKKLKKRKDDYKKSGF